MPFALDQLDPATVFSWVTRTSTGLRVDVCARTSRLARCWYVLVPHEIDGEQAYAVLAFDRPEVPAGTVIDNDTFTHLPVRSDEQLGAVRWLASSGMIRDLYVTAEARGNGLSVALGAVAGACQRLFQLGPPVWGSPIRTAAGEAVAQAMTRFKARIPERTAIGRIEWPARLGDPEHRSG